MSNLKNSFQITLGNIKYGKFYGAETYYYHVGCLNNGDPEEVKLKIPVI
ncbi:MAG: hypothetical protein ACFFFT_04090 [Candidatus Thorarchaeota archaeon]